MNQAKIKLQVSFIEFGIFYGYAWESIQAFLDRNASMRWGVDMDVVPTSEGTEFYGTGFIPSIEQTKRPLYTVIAEINANRFASWPFTLSDDTDPSTEVRDAEFKAFCETKRFAELMREGVKHLKLYC